MKAQSLLLFTMLSWFEAARSQPAAGNKQQMEVDPQALAQEMLKGGEGRVNLPNGYETGQVGFSQVFPWLFDSSLLPEVMSSKGLLIALCTLFMGIVLYYAVYEGAGADGGPQSKSKNKKNKAGEGLAEEEGQGEPLRDFTIAQLREFDGGKDNDKPIYVSLRGEVFDVSTAREFYGKGSGYHCFAGREASRALAKLSFEEEEIANTRLSDLNAMELNSLDDWIDKFKNYKCYPVVGRCSAPPQCKPFTIEELKPYRGDAERAIPEGRIDAPIYVGFNGKVYDVSYGGKEYYGVGAPYLILTGIDATRALSKMSFAPEDVGSRSITDLTEAQHKTLKDWEKKFEAKYPVVGTI